MNLLQQLAHLLSNHPAAQGQAVPHPMTAPANRFQPVQGGQHPALQHQQYAQYMNPNGTGGGFGPNNPSAAPAQTQFTPYQSAGVGQANNYVNAQQYPQIGQGGNVNPGYMPLQRTGYGGPGATYGLQPTDLNYSPYAPIQQGTSPQKGIGLY